MNTPYLYFLFCLLITRMFYQWDKEVNTTKTEIIILIIELILLFPLVPDLGTLVFFLCFLIVYHSIIQLSERKGSRVYIKRTIQLILIIFAGGFLFGILSFNFRTDTAKIIEYVINHNAVLQNLSILKIRNILLCVVGILILSNEVNNLIRYILELINIKEEDEEKGTNNETDKIKTKEIKRGKIIGIIERILFFFFVITGNYSSIAFILAAKGITRYKSMENDKDFAEYVLIGTLLSSSLAIFTGFYFQKIIC